MSKTAVVCGGGGFIGSHLVKRLKGEGYWVRAVDIKEQAFSPTVADEYILGDLRDAEIAKRAVTGVEEVYQLAADMGGMGFISGENDSEIMHNSTMINLNIADAARETGTKKLFYSSSACIYPQRNQQDPDNPMCREDSAYPAEPDSEYGWEKLFGERLFKTYGRHHNLDVKIARFHNVFGPEGTWQGGREKAPAALCRKVAQAPEGSTIEVWGKGDQTRSFLYIDECLEGVRHLMESGFGGPVNIGSEEMISINDLARMVIGISGKNLNLVNVEGPEGVRGRNSDNTLIRAKLNWAPSQPLRLGMERTYEWVAAQVKAQIKQTAAAV
ncbi:MAG: NAD-dependent epimerase/dehydratase family protein [Candidatus Andersenbacteria bacterium]